MSGSAGDIHVRRLTPLLEDEIPPEFAAAPAIPFIDKNEGSRVLKLADGVMLYRDWKNASLKANPAAFRKFATEVEVRDHGQSYHYYYPVDLDYLLSPLWRKENLSSPMGLFRWGVEMEAALQANAILSYENVGLASSFLASAFSMIRAIEERHSGYRKIDMPIAGALYLYTFLHHLALSDEIEGFIGNERQVALAKKVGISNLGQLFSALSHFEGPGGKSWTKILGYNQINLPVVKVATLLEELKSNWKNYIGNERQAALAKKVGISNLGQLFSALSNLEGPGGKHWTKILGYKIINLPVVKVATLLEELKGNWQTYTGNEQQVALAKKVGISHLRQLFSALSNLTGPGDMSWAKTLRYKMINLPAAKLEALLEELNSNWQTYTGNERQAALAKKVGISNLAHLFNALSNLEGPGGKHWTKILGYNQINLPVAKVEALLEELNGNWQTYTGNEQQVALAKKAGISHLGQLFTALSNLTGPDLDGKSWAKTLKYNCINLPAAKVAGFFGEFIVLINTHQLPINRFVWEFAGLKPAECLRRFRQIKERAHDLHDFLSKNCREDWPATFYDYLLKTLPFLAISKPAPQIVGEIIIYIEKNYERIEAIISDPAVPLSYDELRSHFGEFTLPVVKFHGGQRGIESKRRGGLKEIRAMDLPFVRFDGDKVVGRSDRTPLEEFLIKEEKRQVEMLKKAIGNLEPIERKIIQGIFFDGKDSTEVAKSLGMSPGQFRRELERVYEKLKLLIEETVGNKPPSGVPPAATPSPAPTSPAPSALPAPAGGGSEAAPASTEEITAADYEITAAEEYELDEYDPANDETADIYDDDGSAANMDDIWAIGAEVYAFDVAAAALIP